MPSALPYLFAALKVTYPLALIGAVVAEWFTGDRGLGLVIYRGELQPRHAHAVRRHRRPRPHRRVASTSSSPWSNGASSSGIESVRAPSNRRSSIAPTNRPSAPRRSPAAASRCPARRLQERRRRTAGRLTPARPARRRPPDKVTFMAGFKPQANLPFVGAYVAKEKGFFEEQNLDVEIQHVNTPGDNFRSWPRARCSSRPPTPPAVLEKRGRRPAAAASSSIALIGQTRPAGVRRAGGLRHRDAGGLGRQDAPATRAAQPTPDYLAILDANGRRPRERAGGEGRVRAAGPDRGPGGHLPRLRLQRAGHPRASWATTQGVRGGRLRRADARPHLRHHGATTCRRTRTSSSRFLKAALRGHRVRRRQPRTRRSTS